MISLFFLCLVCVESSVGFESGAVDGATTSNVRLIAKSLTLAKRDARFDNIPDRLLAKSILSRHVRSELAGRDESKSSYYSNLRRYAQKLLDSPWGDKPISKFLTTVVFPGIVVTHGKVADLGHLSLVAVTHLFSTDHESETNMTIFHGNLKTSYKYNLDGPKGRLEVKAPGRMYSISLSSKTEGSECITRLSGMALEKEEVLEFSAHGESSEDVNPHVKFLEHVLTLESRRTAFFNIQAAVEKKVRSVKPPFCQDIP